MTDGGLAKRDLIGGLTGCVLVGAAGLTPLLAWIGPLGFAPLLALMGLLSLPAVRLKDEDRPGLIVLFAMLIWAAASTTWSPYVPKKIGNSGILKLAFELPLYFAAVCGARRASPALRDLALKVFATATAAFSLLMIVEAILGAGIYRTLHEAFYEPIRPDLARSNLGHASFVFALLWPLATLAAPVKLRPWFGLLIGMGVLMAGMAFGSDAPVLACLLTPAVVYVAWRRPETTPKVLAGLVATYLLLTPALIWGLGQLSLYDNLERAAPLSWALRMGYWIHAVDWIIDHPLRGWGLDASRMFGPGIQLHPHNGSLQLWLELGAVGAVGAAAFFVVTILRLARPKRSLALATAAGCVVTYVLFGAVNFGVWQEWWLALGALACAFTAALTAREARPSTAST